MVKRGMVIYGVGRYAGTRETAIAPPYHLLFTFIYPMSSEDRPRNSRWCITVRAGNGSYTVAGGHEEGDIERDAPIK